MLSVGKRVKKCGIVIDVNIFTFPVLNYHKSEYLFLKVMSKKVSRQVECKKRQVTFSFKFSYC